MKVGDKVKIKTSVRRYGKMKGEIIKLYSPEYGVKLSGYSAPTVWVLESEMEHI